jgi:glutathione S-transferase
MRVYGDTLSGNCYKVKLLASILGIDHEWVHVDILKGESRTPAFLAMNPNGRVPLLVLDDGRCLWESNAVINYLAGGTSLLPDDEYQRAQALQWQFFEQYSHEPYIAVARFIAVYLGLPEDRRDEYESRREGGVRALSIMDQHLARQPYFTGDLLSVADISLYAYTHVAPEGGFELDEFSNVTDWLTRVSGTPGYVGMG